MEEVLTGSWEGGGAPPDLRELLQGGGSGYCPIWSRDLGHVPQYWEDPWWVPPQGVLPAGGNVCEAGHDG